VRRTSLALVSSTVTLVALGVGFTGAASAHSAAGPALTVNVTAGRHPISRDIYGMNFAPASLERQLKLPVARWGGNATTRYNYRLDTANHASDWYFENIPNTDARPGALPNGSTADQFIGQNRRQSRRELSVDHQIRARQRGPVGEQPREEEDPSVCVLAHDLIDP